MSGIRVTPSVHRHVQASPSAEWNIRHNVGAFGSKGVPVVNVLINDPSDGHVRQMLPANVTIVDPNNVTISFTHPYAGVAIIIG